MMDNVNDLTYVPLEIQKENLKNKRRIGLGIMGLGSALMMMKIRYGSKESVAKVEELMKFISNTAYKASSEIAKEKGSFPLYDEDKYLNSEFLKVLEPETIDMIKKNGIRNSHLLSIQPTGNTSILANCVSGGLEPVFMHEYVRTYIVPIPPKGLDIPAVDWNNVQPVGEWTVAKEGDEEILRTTFEGRVYKIDRNRGLTSEEVVEDYAVKFLKSIGEWDETADWASTTTTLGANEHVDVMKVCSKYIDSAMSKTINLPEEYSYEDFKDLYTDIWKSGTIKGGTTYRAGTMTEVLGAVKRGIPKTDAPKRPKELECDVYHVTAKGEEWTVIVGLYEEDPYEVFSIKGKIGKHKKSGIVEKVKSKEYNLIMGDKMYTDITANNTNEENALTRLISTALRHGAKIDFIVEQLDKAEGSIVSFSKAIARTLKKYIEDTGDAELECTSGGNCKIVREEGCIKCLTCGKSMCG